MWHCNFWGSTTTKNPRHPWSPTCSSQCKLPQTSVSRGYDPFEETKIFRSFCLKHFELFSPWNGRFFQGETLRLTLIARKQSLRLVWCCSSIKWNGSTNSGWSIWPSQIQEMNQGPAPKKRHDIWPTKQQPNYDWQITQHYHTFGLFDPLNFWGTFLDDPLLRNSCVSKIFVSLRMDRFHQRSLDVWLRDVGPSSWARIEVIGYPSRIAGGSLGRWLPMPQTEIIGGEE